VIVKPCERWGKRVTGGCAFSFSYTEANASGARQIKTNRTDKKMKNAFSRIGQTCVFGVLMASAMFATSVDRVTVTLPHAVTVGTTTLPRGEYTLSAIDMGDGTEYFLMRSEHMPTVTLPAYRIDPSEASGKTQVTLQKDGDLWRLDKLFVHGSDNSGYQFIDQK
jgi:hypothetical protein